METFGRMLSMFNIQATEEEIRRAAELSRPAEPAAPLADLSEQQKERVLASHRETMQAFGYLD